MSIPWRGCSPEHIVQLATAAAAFLAPFALVLLSKKATALAKKLREKAKAQSLPQCHSPKCSSKRVHQEENESRGASAQDPCQSVDKQPASLQDVFRDVDFNQNEDQGSLRRSVRLQRGDGGVVGVLVSSPLRVRVTSSAEAKFCECEKKQLVKGERADYGKKPAQMEPPHSDICLREKGKPSDTLGEQKRSLEALKNMKARESNPRDPCKAKEQARGQQLLEAEKLKAEQGYKDLIDELKNSIQGHVERTDLEGSQSSETKETTFPSELAKPGDPAHSEAAGLDSDKSQNELSIPDPVNYSDLSNKRQPRSGEEPSCEEVATTPYETDATETDSQGSGTEDGASGALTSDVGYGDDSEGDSEDRGDDVTEDSNTTDEGEGAGGTSAHAEVSISHPSLVAGASQQQPLSLDFAEQNQDGEESQGEPRHSLSRTSSCESYSTANCSSSSSGVDLRQVAATLAELSDAGRDGYKSPRQENKDRRGNRPDVRERHVKNTGHLNRGQAPIFKLITPPQRFFLCKESTQEDASQRSRESEETLYSSEESPLTSDDAGEVDTSGLEAGSQSEGEGTENLAKWLTARLSSWLPDFSASGHAREPTCPIEEWCQPQGNQQMTEQEQYETYDVRNILLPETKSLWDSLPACEASGPKACPHSCVSSLCNFRRTLESWKKQLLAMHTALDASASALSKQPCVYCQEDHVSGSNRHCYTARIAHIFWRTVLDFKRSHLENSNCPYSQREPGSASQNNEEKDREPCAKGHRHSCASDYVGCSQHQNAPTSDEGSREAPCVHVLLDDVELLLMRLETLKQSFSPCSSQSDQTSHGKTTQVCEQCSRNCSRCYHKLGQMDNPCIRTKNTSKEPAETKLAEAEPAEAQPTLNEDGRYNEEKSTTMSVLSPSPSISLAEELGDLEDLADVILHDYDPSTPDPSSEEELEDLEDFVEPDLQNEEIGDAPYGLDESASCQESSTKSHEAPRVSSLSNQSSRQLDMLPPCETSGEGTVSRSEELTASRTRALGKFALRYIEHIEKKLDDEDRSTPSPERAASLPSCGGDIPKPLPRAAVGGTADVPDGQPGRDSASPRQKLKEALRLHLPVLSSEVSNPEEDDRAGSTMSQSDSRCSGRQSYAGSDKSADKEPSLVVAVKDIISDLSKLQSVKNTKDFHEAVASSKEGKNVQFTLPNVQRTRSETSTTPRQNMNSPPLPLMLPSSSSCLSLTVSGEDVGGKDMSINQAFDQLDKVMDDLLELIHVPQES